MNEPWYINLLVGDSTLSCQETSPYPKGLSLLLEATLILPIAVELGIPHVNLIGTL